MCAVMLLSINLLVCASMFSSLAQSNLTDSILEVVAYEARRLFRDRLVSSKDVHNFENILSSITRGDWGSDVLDNMTGMKLLLICLFIRLTLRRRILFYWRWLSWSSLCQHLLSATHAWRETVIDYLRASVTAPHMALHLAISLLMVCLQSVNIDDINDIFFSFSQLVWMIQITRLASKLCDL